MDLDYCKHRLEQVVQALKQLENNYNVALGQKAELELMVVELEKEAAALPAVNNDEAVVE